MFILNFSYLQQNNRNLLYRINLVRNGYFRLNTYAMKNILSLLFLIQVVAGAVAQPSVPTEKQKKDLTALIDKYSEARENRDTVLLKAILTQDIDQLVSTGEWRNGLATAIQGMLRSSATKPGSRTLTVEFIKTLNSTSAIVDCRYEIKNEDGSTRKMWSSFICVVADRTWKISSIRNMLPSNP